MCSLVLLSFNSSTAVHGRNLIMMQAKEQDLELWA